MEVAQIEAIQRIYSKGGTLDEIPDNALFEILHMRAEKKRVGLDDLNRAYWMSRTFDPTSGHVPEPHHIQDATMKSETPRTMTPTQIAKKSGVYHEWLLRARRNGQIDGNGRSRYVLNDKLLAFIRSVQNKLPQHMRKRADDFIANELGVDIVRTDGADVDSVLDEVLRFNAAEKREMDEQRREAKADREVANGRYDAMNSEVLKLTNKLSATERRLKEAEETIEKMRKLVDGLGNWIFGGIKASDFDNLTALIESKSTASDSLTGGLEAVIGKAVLTHMARNGN